MDTHSPALADRLENAHDLCIDLLLRRLSSCGEEFFAADAVRRIGKFEKKDVGAGLQPIRLWVKDLTLEDNVLYFILDYAQLTRLARHTAPDNNLGGKSLRLRILCRMRGCRRRGGGLRRNGRHSGWDPVCPRERTAERGLLADDAAGTADTGAHGTLDAPCRTALCEQFRTERSRCRKAYHISVHGIVRLHQCVIENGIPGGGIANDTLPQRGNSRCECNDILLDEHLRQLIVFCYLCCGAVYECVIHDHLRADDDFPRIAAYLDMTHRTGTQKSPLLIVKSEPVQQAQQQIRCTRKDAVCLRHFSYSLL